MIKTLNTRYTKATLSVYFFFASTANSHAATLKDIFDDLARSLQSVPTFLSILCYIVGIYLVFSGVVYTNKAKNYPQQAEMSTGIWRIIIGVVLLILPFIINSIAESFGASSTTLSKPVF